VGRGPSSDIVPQNIPSLPSELSERPASLASFAAGLLHVDCQIDLDTGLIQWPKDDPPREIVMSPALHSHLEIFPGIGAPLAAISRVSYDNLRTWRFVQLSGG
jgi:hypothetical protein